MAFSVQPFLMQRVQNGVQRPVESVRRTALVLVLLVVPLVYCVARLENSVSVNLRTNVVNGLG